jgi:hypothetical protein
MSYDEQVYVVRLELAPYIWCLELLKLDYKTLHYNKRCPFMPSDLHCNMNEFTGYSERDLVGK